MSLTFGTKLGPYEIVAPLGAGGMGEVYRAKDTRLGRDVAVKVLPEHLASAPEVRARFEREAKTISSLNHPHICTLFDVGHQDGVDFLVLELLEGEALRARLAGGPLPIERAIAFAAQIASGLSAAHDKGVVHRDLKPENVFVTRDGPLKILDFGLAKVASGLVDPTGSPSAEAATIDATRPGAIFGTVGYMSPEQVRGMPADARSDLFAFGAILYEMLPGQRAFAGGSSAEILSATLRDEPRPLSKLDSRIPAALERIVSSCLEKDPEKRPQVAKSLVHDLQRIAAAPGGSSASKRGSSQAPRRIWIASALVAAVAIIVIAADVGGIRSHLLENTARRQISSLAVLPMSNLSGSSDQDYFAEGMTEELRTDLSRIRGLRVASRSSAAHYGRTREPILMIARQLEVDAIVQGTVTRSGDRVSVDASLVDGVSGKRLWRERFERSVRDIPSLHGQIAQAIAREVYVDMSASTQQRLAAAHAVDPAAHEAYLRGRFYWKKRDKDAVKKGLDHFARAVELDPDYAHAYAGLADSYVILGVHNFMPPKEAFPAAKAAAAKALELDETLAEAHATLGDAHLHYD